MLAAGSSNVCAPAGACSSVVWACRGHIEAVAVVRNLSLPCLQRKLPGSRAMSMPVLICAGRPFAGLRASSTASAAWTTLVRAPSLCVQSTFVRLQHCETLAACLHKTINPRA